MNVIELLEELNMPQEAIQAAKNQINILNDLFISCDKRQKELIRLTWEHQPETIDEMTHECYYCDDCDCYHQHWTGHGFLVENGELHVTEWTCDLDGDWDCGGSEQVVTVEEFNEATHVDWDRIQNRWNDYYKYVADTGNDHLGQLFSQDKEKQTWMTYFRNHPDGVQVVSSQKIEPEAGVLLKGENIPKEILEFCEAGENRIMDPELCKDVLGLLQEVHVGCGVLEINDEAVKDGCLALKVRVSMQRDPEVVKQELKEKARKAIKDSDTPYRNYP